MKLLTCLLVLLVYFTAHRYYIRGLNNLFTNLKPNSFTGIIVVLYIVILNPTTLALLTILPLLFICQN